MLLVDPSVRQDTIAHPKVCWAESHEELLGADDLRSGSYCPEGWPSLAKQESTLNQPTPKGCWSMLNPWTHGYSNGGHSMLIRWLQKLGGCRRMVADPLISDWLQGQLSMQVTRCTDSRGILGTRSGWKASLSFHPYSRRSSRLQPHWAWQLWLRAENIELRAEAGGTGCKSNGCILYELRGGMSWSN